LRMGSTFVVVGEFVLHPLDDHAACMFFAVG
jgi:hypothetical protein